MEGVAEKCDGGRVRKHKLGRVTKGNQRESDGYVSQVLKINEQGVGAVSYTHLTLPTKVNV